MNILMVGDVVGSPGRALFKRLVPQLLQEGRVHAVVVNAENVAAGNGITIALARELFEAGASIITLGDHIWGQKGFDATIASEKRIVRPANFKKSVPGETFAVGRCAQGEFAVMSLMGRVFMNPIECPFQAADEVLRQIPGGMPIFVDIHAEATSEKIAMGHYLDGRVTAVVGTHTHVQTNDAIVLPGGTAYLTDLGMTGPWYSVIGREIKPVLKKFTTGLPAKFDVAEGPCVLEGAIIEVPRGQLAATRIETFRFREPLAKIES